MAYERLAYDDGSTSSEMTADAQAAAATLRRAVTRPAPSLRFEDFPGEVPKAQITVDEAAARLAAALHLHLH